MRSVLRLPALVLLCAFTLAEEPVAGPGTRVLMDAHNCYPYQDKWEDRLERALGTGFPLAIEQDLYWYTDPATGRSWSVVSHGDKVTGREPTLRSYFLERIRPYMEDALRGGSRGNRRDWPLITLNLDFKTEQPEHLEAVWDLLGEYEAWLCTAEQVAGGGEPAPLRAGPLLVLTGSSDVQERVFHERVPVGGRLRLFGAVHVYGDNPMAPPDVLVPQGHATNYRRWWNNPWKVVESGGQQKAGKWTRADHARLQALVRHAHSNGLWIRFYTLNGYPPAASKGWSAGYNFGSRQRALLRWRAAIEAGVDFIATDQYEEVAALLRQPQDF